MSSFKSNAQSLMFGLGGSYGTDIQQFAPNLRVYYGMTEQICFGPEFSYFPKINRHGHNIQLSEFGFVGHYIIEAGENLGVYPLIGLNYSIEIEDEIHIEKAFGASLGAGVHWSFGDFMPYAEYKYIMGSLSQSTLNIGLIYNLHLKKVRSH